MHDLTRQFSAPPRPFCLEEYPCAFTQRGGEVEIITRAIGVVFVEWSAIAQGVFSECSLFSFPKWDQDLADCEIGMDARPAFGWRIES
jgi:hypothetical protein